MPSIDLDLTRAVQFARSGQIAEAASLLQTVLRAAPNEPRAHFLMAQVCLNSGRAGEAIGHYERSLAIQPGQAAAHFGRAMAFRSLKRYAEAEEALRAAETLDPASAELRVVRVSVLLEEGNSVDAAEVALEGLRLKPGLVEAADQASYALMLSGWADRAVEVLGEFLKAHPGELGVRASMRALMSYAEGVSPMERTRFAIELGTLLQAKLPTAPAPVVEQPDPDRPLRIGYLAQDISERSAVAFFIEQVFAHHDRERYPVTCYLTQPGMGVISPRMRAHLSRWADVSRMNDLDLSRRIRGDKIDILVDLAGRTPGNRLPALLLGPAPIVVSAIGDPETSGLSRVHYRFVDAITDPPGCEAQWTEQLVRLPRCFLCYRPPDDAPPSRRPRAAEDPITFGSFNVLAKTGPRVVALWAKLLKEVPGSRLLLKAPPLDHPRVRESIESRFAGHGIGSDRLTLIGRSEALPEHLRMYERVDIALDPFPYNGTTTSCEALWMGVPLITLLGRSHAGRVGASLLTAVGLEDLVAADVDDFVRIAAALARDAARLSALQSSLRSRVASSVLCDGKSHGSAVESAFREMWRVKCAESRAST